jgi:hypothetical protein
MTDFNRELYPEGYARCKQLYRFARQHITDLIADLPLNPEDNRAMWDRKAKLFLLGAEEVHDWLDAEDGLDDSAWIDDDEAEEEEDKDVKNRKSDAAAKPDQRLQPIKPSGPPAPKK